MLVARAAAPGVVVRVLGARAHGRLRDDVLVLPRGRGPAGITDVGGTCSRVHQSAMSAKLPVLCAETVQYVDIPAGQ